MPGQATAEPAGHQFPPPCTTGSPTCVRETLTTMRDQLRPLEDHCDHRVIFSFAYLRTTEAFGDAAAVAGSFADPGWVNAEDALFARYYFRAFDQWAAGRPTDVPPAWRVAFTAAATTTLSAAGDLLLGMNAHVTRDLPFVLAELGLAGPDGHSHKGDHDRVNAILARVMDPLLAQEAARFDPHLDDGTLRYGLGRDDLIEMLTAWREDAWHDAERLVAARGTDEYAVVVHTIETSADVRARLLRVLLADEQPSTTAVPRDAWCARHHASDAVPWAAPTGRGQRADEI
ncbi:DUF5995 family protein [Frankia sp. Cas3]|uniref:DUF5995 family protein n=1 Tax=Frankia sp. Cas3 TaxID=3073926 RepID=UPI002AD50B02|nr:DUF5995 family protein [Frankia sp. Cas3]